MISVGDDRHAETFFNRINWFVSGIFAYLNYLTPKTRREVLDLLITGLRRQEYRGYDSAGVAIDTQDGKSMLLVRRSGKVQALEDAIVTGNHWAESSERSIERVRLM